MKKTRNFAALIGVLVLFLFIFQIDTRESAAADIVSVQPHFAEGPDGIVMAVEMAFPQGYHAYAHESGDAGRPTTLSIRLDDGSGLPVWYPQGFMQRDLFDPDATVYVYESPTTLFVLLPHEARHRGFEAVLSMLLCSSRNCLPVSQTISGQVPDTLPGLEEAPWKARWEELRRLPPVLSKGSAPVSGLPFAMDEGGAGGLSAVTDPAQDPLAALQEEDGEKPLPPPDGFALELTPQYTDGSVEISGFGMALAVGILAGLLLNAMPCVLPVLTFKISGLLLMGGRGDKESLRRFREHNLFFSAGIMTLFTLLALVLGAADMIWGQLYQQQSLLLGLVMLVFLMGLSMLGVFTLPVIDLKAGANSKNPRLQPYLTGLVSTFLATPCSGPLLGGVLGWAFTQPLLVLMVVFWAVGLGMALPYILFSIWPQLARILPRPGNWMKIFERVLGFCLLGTALYLLSILPVEKHMQVLCVLLVLVAAAVAVFITCAAQVKAYAFLETEPFETAYGVTGMVRERRAAAAPEHTRGKVAGTVLCILSAVPLFIAVCLNGPDLLYVAAVCLLLVLAGVGSALFVYGGVYQAAMDRLLEEGDYVRPRKRQNGVVGAISSIYWLTVTAAYLLWTFGPWWDAQPQDTWILWAVAGVLYGAVMALVRGIRK